MNKMDKRFSDEFLNSFVDNQLTPEEKSQAYSEIAQDETVNRQVCELRKLHDLVQLAYRDVPPPPSAGRSSGTRRRGWLRFGVAASILLAVGATLGLRIDISRPVTSAAVAQLAPDRPMTTVSQQPDTRNRPARPRAATVAARTTAMSPAPAATTAMSAAVAVPATKPADPEEAALSSYQVPAPSVLADRTTNRVLVHVTNNDPKRLLQALQDIEGLMHYYQDSRRRARVEVVANGPGLDLLRSDTSKFSEQIARLQKQYGNLKFAACQNTIDHVREEQGIKVPLLPGVIVIDSGMAEIMRRQTEGWTYLQV